MDSVNRVVNVVAGAAQGCFEWYRGYVPAEYWMVEVAVLLIPLLYLLNKAFHANDQEPLFDDERYYIDAETGEKKTWGNLLKDEPTVSLSVVIPAYNEEERMPIMLEEAYEYLEGVAEKEEGFTYELLIVDDGSKDKTTEVGMSYGKKWGGDKVKVLKAHHNRGKGGAVRLGSLRASGEQVLFADADGATKFADVESLQRVLKETSKNGHGVVVGSRNHLKEKAKAQRAWHRNLMMHVFNTLVRLCVSGINDTQCGFKLMTRKSARAVYPR
eukprot:TRINITY_DN995_c0_g1_i3.p1 TRINITY_DN995_c0_g1~~TRINITY_DN995_c0_g1_i3.p1  ORF type:complete len:271 (+),score=84.00 TRINITY_DN995_c0_g1_i3:373-1185(+)